MNAKKIETWGLDFEKLTFLDNDSIVTFEEFIKTAFSKLFQIHDDTILGDKNNYYVRHSNELKEYYPGAKFIILIRNPLSIYDSAMRLKNSNSQNTHPYYPDLKTNIDAFVEDYVSVHLDIISSLWSGLPEQLVIEYEKLISQPKQKFNEVFRFLNVLNEDVVNGHVRTNDEPKEFASWKSNTKKKIQEIPLSPFVKSLNKSDLNLLNEAHHFVLSKMTSR
jgi:hypothetical protein